MVKQITVTDQGRPVGRLNELEFVKGEIFANIWQTDVIARISPDSGQITGWIDLGGLSRQLEPTAPIDCLNGIAYDKRGDRLFVTGKLWPKLFEIQLIKK
jgi:glutamine cyclotransferase